MLALLLCRNYASLLKIMPKIILLDLITLSMSRQCYITAALIVLFKSLDQRLFSLDEPIILLEEIIG